MSPEIEGRCLSSGERVELREWKRKTYYKIEFGFHGKRERYGLCARLDRLIDNSGQKPWDTVLRLNDKLCFTFRYWYVIWLRFGGAGDFVLYCC